jgi:hypothetical protein
MDRFSAVGGDRARGPRETRASRPSVPRAGRHAHPNYLRNDSGSGFLPLSRRWRTSRAVVTETPACRAISRNEARGFVDKNFAARRRPLAGLTGRVFPSRPSRGPNLGISSVAHPRNLPTVLFDTPAISAIDRSDQCGYDAKTLLAAALRSERVSGKPWVTLRCTASAKASPSSPSKISLVSSCRRAIPLHVADAHHRLPPSRPDESLSAATAMVIAPRP